MDFHKKFSIAKYTYLIEDLKFLSFWLLSLNHCCHGNPTHFMAITTFYTVLVFMYFYEIWNFQNLLLPWQLFHYVSLMLPGWGVLASTILKSILAILKECRILGHFTRILIIESGWVNRREYNLNGCVEFIFYEGIPWLLSIVFS